MKTVTVSDKGQVVIPAEIRRQLGITPGCQLDFILDGNAIRIELKRRIRPSRPEEGYGMLVCQRPGQRRLSDFDVAQAMRDALNDRS
ncbi:MAG: AbrB/MazE/SpoVT family DNA-binding domain-containing protein [Candidatus Competibacter sp.]|jgi:AbrB family looped-hinge helix DNA binding protein|nr:MAG: AbrB/MazE/SpoVT family DNA-binding domain-containing protein [Candidatus Contendobacter sp.]MDS4068533.1 AbrB/MazE/SpoVT family DNA-binding domain-containing protein [Candidatus Competibacter sp.]